jgi:hypothetical protein
MRVLTYKGDVTHLLGDKTTCPYLLKDGGVEMKAWVATDVWYNEETNKTRVEMDEVAS